ncbi:MAG: GAF domain-containing protein [Gaiellaceae bacterium]
MAGEQVERAAAALEREQTVSGLLGTACRELVETFDAQACVVSRVVGDLLILLSEFATDEGQDLGHEYLISDYPLTAETIALGEPRMVSLLDEAPEPMEASLLRRFGFDSLLMVCLPANGVCWGLIEIYANGKTFDEGQAAAVGEISALIGRRLEHIEAS